MVQTHLVLVALAQYTHVCHVSCMHHIVAYCLVMLCIGALCGRFCLRGYLRISDWRAVPYYYSIRQAAPLIISIQSHVLAPALIYCIRQQHFKLLCDVVVEPISSAWPVITIVNRWNPLARLGVVWALMSCLLLLRVESGLIHRGWIRGVWTCPTVWAKCVNTIW